MISHIKQAIPILKQAVDESGKSLKYFAEVTKVSDSSVSRYLNGEQTPALEFIILLAEALDISLDELFGNPTGAKHAAENAALEALRASYEHRLEDKREHIASLKNRIERMEATHAAELERLEKSLNDQIVKAEKVAEDRRKRMDKKNKYIVILFIVIIIVSLTSFYCILDAFNGDWGLIRYELYAMPWRDAASRLTDWFSL